MRVPSKSQVLMGRADECCLQVEAIERAGGQLIADGSRRRSPGGVFWNVVKQRVKPEVYTSIFAEEQAKSVRLLCRAPVEVSYGFTCASVVWALGPIEKTNSLPHQSVSTSFYREQAK